MTKKQLELLLAYIDQRVDDTISGTLIGGLYGVTPSENALKIREELETGFSEEVATNEK